MAQRILIIERSATFRAKLKKALAFSGHDLHTCELFEQAATLLPHPHSETKFAYDAVIVGWPSYTDSVADSVLVSLQQSEMADIPMIFCSEDGDPARLDWITNRPLTKLLSWEDVANTNELLNHLVEAAQKTTPTAASTNENHKNIRVLLVDDSPTVRHNFKLSLERDKYNVLVASNVDEAYSIATQEQIDIAIIDYFMPNGNGDLLIKRLKRNEDTRKIEIAVLTGGYSDQVIRECLAAGATECMFKNEGVELFLARIHSIARTVLQKRALLVESERFEKILESVGDGVYGVDETGVIQFMNTAARRMLGRIVDDQIIGKKAVDVIHHSRTSGEPHDDSSCPLHRGYIYGHTLDKFRTVFWTNRGKSFPVECTLNPIQYDERTTGTVVAFQDISRQVSREAELEWQATHDPLTQLMNREAFEEALIDEISNLKLTDTKSALMFIDVDRFKYINDTAGHLAGDQILVEVGNRLTSQLGQNDRIARVSGDEFAIILTNIDWQPEKLIEAADRFREVIECQKFYVEDFGFSTSITAGISILDQHTHSIADSMSHADQACNLAKNRGRNRIHIYNAEDSHAGESGEDLGWATKLRDALVWNRFQIHYQPLIALDEVPTNWDAPFETNNWDNWYSTPPNRYEALLRLRDADGALIHPDAFLPLAERFEMISRIDRWVIRNTFEDMAKRSAWPELEMFINVSVTTLMSADLPEFMVNLIDKTGIDPTTVVFEITESQAVRNIREANACIAKLRTLGLRFALDDFGSGYSSFYHLKNLDVDIIKIDGIFTRELSEDNIGKSVMLSINEVAHSLNKKTVVEHIDSPEVLKALIGSGIDYMQGYFLAEPLEKLPNPAIRKNEVVDR